MFKSNRIYSIINAPSISPEDLETAMNEHLARDLGAAQGKAVGWTTPAGRGTDTLVMEVQAQRLMAVMTQQRLLPSSVINEELAELKDAIETREGRKVTKKELQTLKEEITAELMPRAFIKKTVTKVWWDVRRNRIIVDATSEAAAEAVLDLLRQTLGSLKVVPFVTKELPVRVMTGWLKDPATRPAWLSLGGDATLKATGDGTTFGVKKGDLDGDEVETMIGNGSVVDKLEVNCEGEASLELNSDLSIKKIKLDDRVLDEAASAKEDDPIGRLQTDFIVMADTLAKVYGLLEEAMGGLAHEATTADAA